MSVVQGVFPLVRSELYRVSGPYGEQTISFHINASNPLDSHLKIAQRHFGNSFTIDKSRGDVLVSMKDSMLIDQYQRPYTALSLLVLSSLSFNGNNVLDFGSADGIFGLYAKLQGADKLYAIESNASYRPALRKNLISNGLHANDVEFVCSDILNDDWQGKIPLDSIDVIIANIGPHYDQTDLHVLKSLDRFPNAVTFVGGGYAARGMIERFDFRPLSPELLLEYLTEIGFSQQTMFSEIDDSGHFGRQAFVASKPFGQAI